MRNLLSAIILSVLLVSPALADVYPLLSNNLSGTVTTGGTFQDVSVQNTGRKGCVIQNPITATETLFVFLGPVASATTTKSINLAPGASFYCGVPYYGVAGDEIAVTGATTAHAFVAYFQ